jgi:hypothetical protein
MCFCWMLGFKSLTWNRKFIVIDAFQNILQASVCWEWVAMPQRSWSDDVIAVNTLKYTP